MLDTPAFYTYKTGYIDRSMTLAPQAFLAAIDGAIQRPRGERRPEGPRRRSTSAPTTSRRRPRSTWPRSTRRCRRAVRRHGDDEPHRLALAPESARATRRVLPAALDGHGPRRRGGRLRPGDGRPDRGRLRPPRCGRIGQGRFPRALDRRADPQRGLRRGDPGLRRRCPDLPRPGGRHAARTARRRPGSGPTSRRSSARPPTPRRSSSSTSTARSGSRRWPSTRA